MGQRVYIVRLNVVAISTVTQVSFFCFPWQRFGNFIILKIFQPIPFQDLKNEPYLKVLGPVVPELQCSQNPILLKR